MPELPDLEVLREVLSQRVVGRTMVDVQAIRPGILKTVEPGVESLKGLSFTGMSRRGKHLILTAADDLHLVVHLMLAGRMVLCKSGTKLTKATGFAMTFDDGEDLRIIENGHVKRVGVHLVRDPNEVERIAKAGIEPLSEDFTAEVLAGLLTRKRQLKKVLTDQRLIGGIGSAYADEILFAAKLSPIRYVSAMQQDEIARLHRTIREVLSEAIEKTRERAGGVILTEHLRDFMSVYKRTGEPCPVCETPIAEIRYAQTRTYYCPVCQSGGQDLPDRRSWLTR